MVVLFEEFKVRSKCPELKEFHSNSMKTFLRFKLKIFFIVLNFKRKPFILSVPKMYKNLFGFANIWLHNRNMIKPKEKKEKMTKN